MKDSIIVVGGTRLDNFGNLLVTPKGGGKAIKIGAKRANLHPIFEQDRAVLLKWDNYMDKDYVADAELFEGEVPRVVKEIIKEGGELEKVKTNPKYKADPDKTASIELQVCLKCATELSVAMINAGILKEKTTERTKATTKEFSALFLIDTGG